MHFSFKQKVLFKHCDPAGIVFYPRYFEMINDTVEAFFDTALGFPFEDMLKSAGAPTAQISTQFQAVSRHGDMLDIALHLTKLGRSSADLSFTASSAGETRFTAQSTLVYVNAKGRPQPWPDVVRAKMQDYVEPQ